MFTGSFGICERTPHSANRSFWAGWATRNALIHSAFRPGRRVSFRLPLRIVVTFQEQNVARIAGASLAITQTAVFHPDRDPARCACYLPPVEALVGLGSVG